MRKIIYFVFFLAVLSACSKERKPLEILPVMAEATKEVSDGRWERKDYPIPNVFYFKNFKDDKQCMREFLQYIKLT